MPPPPLPPVIKEILNLTIWGVAFAMMTLVPSVPSVVSLIYAIIARKQWERNHSEMMMRYVTKARK